MLESLKEITAYMNLSEQGKQALVTTHATPLFYSGGTGLRGLGLGQPSTGGSRTGGNMGGNYGQPGAGGVISGYDGNDLVGKQLYYIALLRFSLETWLIVL